MLTSLTIWLLDEKSTSQPSCHNLSLDKDLTEPVYDSVRSWGINISNNNHKQFPDPPAGSVHADGFQKHSFNHLIIHSSSSWAGQNTVDIDHYRDKPDPTEADTLQSSPHSLTEAWISFFLTYVKSIWKNNITMTLSIICVKLTLHLQVM